MPGLILCRPIDAYEAKIVKLNPNSMEYDVELAGLHIPCIGAATCNEDGLITEYIVRPR